MQALRQQRVGWQHALRASARASVPRHPRRTVSALTPGGKREKRWRQQESLRQEHEKLERLPGLTTKWQHHWDGLRPEWHNLPPRHKGKAYVLPMFPYPSGTLHLGHLRVYTISDVIARFKHMQGYQVLHPIAWDAFGLPAENAAIERGLHPEKWTLQNIDSMKQQIKTIGGHWNWDAEFLTCDPTFYKHTQRIFLMLYERGLAYQAESLVNYDPVDKTVLANEQVDANGFSWRSGAKAEKIMLKQWFLKIKEFQEPLLDDLQRLSDGGTWPERVLAMQRNWIGKSEGVTLAFPIICTNGTTNFEPVQVFTTRPDTIFGVQYIALSIHHPIVQRLATNNELLRSFIDRTRTLPPDSKEGFLLSEAVAKNPIADISELSSSVPVYVAPYVLEEYGSGAVMGVPGHDTRDHAFWRQNAGSSPINVVICSKPHTLPSLLVPGEEDRPEITKGFVAENIDRFRNLSSEEAAHEVIEALSKAGTKIERTINWRLRDWLISRQRYWGTPIPIIHCGVCGPVAVPVRDLPVELPNLSDEAFKNMKGNPLATHQDWKKTTCPKCGAEAERETDTMDTFMDSSWYFFRYLDPDNHHAPFDSKKANEGMPVDYYIGGIEHAILHLLYARFISKFLATTPAWPQGENVSGEPFQRLITQGMVHGKTFSDPETGRFLRPDEVDTSKPSKLLIKATGLNAHVSYEKMSKSKYNGVDLATTIAKYGADATRAHMLFQAPVGDVVEWDATKIIGIQRWFLRVLRLSNSYWLSWEQRALFRVPTELDARLFDILQDLWIDGNFKVPNTRRPNKPGGIPTILTEEMAFSALTRGDAQLWIQTQNTIANVTESYFQVYSLNTVVSDLMTLTNTIANLGPASSVTGYLKFYAIAQLLRMLAPIAPSVAEEAWDILKISTSEGTARVAELPVTIFGTGFPTAQLEHLSLIEPMQTCVVQIDGKRKFEVEIPKKLPESTEHVEMAMAEWMFSKLMQTKPGKEWLDNDTGKIWSWHKESDPDPVLKYLPRGWSVRVVKDGKLVNLVSPKKAKPVT